MLGTAKYNLVDLVGARRHLERVLTGYSATDLGQAAVRDVIRFQNDGQVEARVMLTGCVVAPGFFRIRQFGWPDKSLAEAQAIGHAGFAMSRAGPWHHARSRCGRAISPAAAGYTRLLVDLSTRHGLSHWASLGCQVSKSDCAEGRQCRRH